MFLTTPRVTDRARCKPIFINHPHSNDRPDSLDPTCKREGKRNWTNRLVSDFELPGKIRWQLSPPGCLIFLFSPPPWQVTRELPGKQMTLTWAVGGSVVTWPISPGIYHWVQNIAAFSTHKSALKTTLSPCPNNRRWVFVESTGTGDKSRVVLSLRSDI